MTGTMDPQRAGDIVLVCHLLFILFVVLGGFLVLRWSWLRYLHLPAALWGALVELQGWTCPLTPLEHHFRRAGGRHSAAPDFIDHYIMPLVYPPGLSRQGQIILGLLVVVINAFIYGYFLRRQRNKRLREGDTTK